MTRTITPTHVLLNQVTLAASASSVTFSSIPQNYGDLVLIINARQTLNNGYMEIQINGDTGSNYNWVTMMGRSNGVISSAGPNQTALQPSSHSQGQEPFSSIIQFLDYSSTDKHKSGLIRHNQYDFSLSSLLVRADAFRWANTNAITSITALSVTQPFTSASTLSLYGVHA